MSLPKALTAVLLLACVMSIPFAAHADCCRTSPSPSVWRNYTGQVVVDIYNGSMCPINVEDCTVIDYAWVWCPNGSTGYQVTYEIHSPLGHDCQYYYPFYCLDIPCTTINNPDGSWSTICYIYCQ